MKTIKKKWIYVEDRQLWSNIRLTDVPEIEKPTDERRYAYQYNTRKPPRNKGINEFSDWKFIFHSGGILYKTFNTEAYCLFKLWNFEIKGERQVSRKTTESTYKGEIIGLPQTYSYLLTTNSISRNLIQGNNQLSIRDLHRRMFIIVLFVSIFSNMWNSRKIQMVEY